MNKQNWQKGDVLLEQYEVLGTLGEGGMGTVYKVHHRGWSIDLAVKSPQPEIFARAGGKENFIREAETWVNLPLYPHIVSCYYVRIIDEIPRIFAEYVAGGSLGDWIGSRRLYEGGHQQALERMLDIAIQFAWGLHTAHEQGLVHQDIKPANVMMTPEGVTKVTDFGLARARAMAGEQGSEEDNGRRSILVSSRGMTPAYCSPEQAAGKALSRKTDIWSWGVSILEMFMGEVTWRSGVLAREVLSSYEPQDVAIPPLPAELVTLLARCFASRPEERPATMLEVAATLQEIYAHKIGQAYPREEPRLAEALADTLNNQALSLYDLGKIEDAKQLWRQALQTDPHHLEATYNQGMILWRAGQMTDENLVHQLEMLLGVQDQRWKAAYFLAQVHLERGDVDTARPLLKEAAMQAPAGSELPLHLEKITSGRMPTNRCIRTLEGHAGGVFSLSLSADGRWLASGSEDQTIRLWEVSSGRCVRIFQGHTDGVHSVSLSADGRWLASGSGWNDATVRLWEVSSGRCARIFQGQTYGVRSVSLSTDGRWLVWGSTLDDTTVRLWEVSSGQCVHTFEGHTSSVGSVSLSRDGHWLVTGSHDRTIRVWDIDTERCIRAFEGHTDSVMSVSLSGDGRWLVSGSALKDATIRLWEVNSGRCLWVFGGLFGVVTSVSLSADGRWLVSNGWDRVARLWEVRTGRCVCTFRGAPSGVSATCLSSDGRLLAIGQIDGTVQLWRIEGLGLYGSLHPSRAHSSVTVAQTESRAEQLLKQAKQMCAETRFATALNLLRELRALPGWEHHPKSRKAWERLSRYCARGSFLASWQKGILQGHADEVSSVSLSGDGRWLVSGSHDRTVRVWEVSSGRCVHTFEGLDRKATSVRLSPEGHWLASTGSLRVWEEHSGWSMRTFQGVGSESLSADGHWLASGEADGSVQLWEVSSGRCVRSFEGHTGSVTSVSLSADGHWLVSGSHDRTVRLWEVNSGRCVYTFKGHTGNVTSVSLSADGRWLVSGSEDKSIHLWELEWELEARDPADWDESARIYLEIFLTQQILDGGTLLKDSESPKQELKRTVMGRWVPTWTEEEFQGLIRHLQYVGYGWLRPEGIRRQLEHMERERQGLAPLLGEKEKNNDECMVGHDRPSKEKRTLENNPHNTYWMPKYDDVLTLLKNQHETSNRYLFPHLLKHRIILINTPIEDRVANSVIAQLLYLQSEDATRDIHLYINSHGGDIYSVLAIYETMQFLGPRIATYCISQVSGSATLLLTAGAKGKRAAITNSTIGLDYGPVDINISARDILRLRRHLVDIFAKRTGQADATLREDMDRGIMLSAKDAITCGFIDAVIDSLEEPSNSDA
ncbi:hypothetical protein KSD_73250 [Ktedonobacter sp. SOSP1-85]|uniref:ATP-dependent Clp protease proteolytic subunit n=1 Tax=Ktedonobacter sp. SOSP1-85 TaxID=2778367 RepID=UPI00191663E6|nr:ATP-dependent Clp protease proteolytic subunit [Ktedonobacter sp. SOSP1-85]GHO79554.1 hypothetical protein KSD_73250 [Ktedonobacter sp. SOSP1-85]